MCFVPYPMRVNNIPYIPLHLDDAIMVLKEEEGTTIIIRKEVADQYTIPYTYISAWITISIHSSLDAVGLTAAFSSALSKEGISCNVVAAYYHDHIFVPYHDVIKAMEVLNRFGQMYMVLI